MTPGNKQKNHHSIREWVCVYMLLYAYSYVSVRPCDAWKKGKEKLHLLKRKLIKKPMKT